jgi:hypothetical protein
MNLLLPGNRICERNGGKQNSFLKISYNKKQHKVGISVIV